MRTISPELHSARKWLRITYCKYGSVGWPRLLRPGLYRFVLLGGPKRFKYSTFRRRVFFCKPLGFSSPSLPPCPLQSGILFSSNVEPSCIHIQREPQCCRLTNRKGSEVRQQLESFPKAQPAACARADLNNSYLDFLVACNLDPRRFAKAAAHSRPCRMTHPQGGRCPSPRRPVAGPRPRIWKSVFMIWYQVSRPVVRRWMQKRKYQNVERLLTYRYSRTSLCTHNVFRGRILLLRT